jgi:[ribosomal protein S5]-alanine N-acetyltransferase
MKFELRPSVEEDREFLWDLRVATMKKYFEETYGWKEEEQRARAMENPSCWIVMAGAERVGAIEIMDRGEDLHLARMQVLPSLQNRGLGSGLLRWAQAQARERGLPLTLQVLRNSPALHLYTRFGFALEGERGFAHVMRWDPRNPPPGTVLRPPKVIETARLRLRPPCIDDSSAIFREYAQDPDVTRYLVWRPHQSESETVAFLERSENTWNDNNTFPWVIECRESGRLMGMIEARMTMHGIEIGYVLAKAHWGKGYMTEALQAVIEWGFEEDSVFRVWAYCNVENGASRRVMEKAGMQYEGVLRKWGHTPNISGIPCDCYCLAITRDRTVSEGTS